MESKERAWKSKVITRRPFDTKRAQQREAPAERRRELGKRKKRNFRDKAKRIRGIVLPRGDSWARVWLMLDWSNTPTAFSTYLKQSEHLVGGRLGATG